MTHVQAMAIVKRFGTTAAIDRINLDVRPGELFTLVGPSGCGKTTLLRIIAGLLEQDEGAVHFNGAPVDAIPPHLRNIGIVFQSYAIFPHLTVAENIAYGLKARRVPPGEIAAKVGEASRLVQLEGLLDRMPGQLSGGQQQRVVLARALVIEPQLLLMDEPLSNLDAKLRLQIRSLIRTLQRTLRITTIYVTHDQEEALAISDTIAVMDRGRVLQVGTPWELYLRPANRFVAEFIGSMNVVQAEVAEPQDGRGGVIVTSFGARWRAPVSQHIGARVTCGLRPESLQLEPGAAGESWNSVSGQVVDVAYLGAVVRYRVQLPAGAEITADIYNPDFAAIRAVGDPLTLWFAPDRLIALPNEDGE